MMPTLPSLAALKPVSIATCVAAMQWQQRWHHDDSVFSEHTIPLNSSCKTIKCNQNKTRYNKNMFIFYTLHCMSPFPLGSVPWDTIKDLQHWHEQSSEFTYRGVCAKKLISRALMKLHHWNQVIMMPTLSSMVAMQVVSRQPAMPPVMTKLASWPLSVSHDLFCSNLSDIISVLESNSLTTQI